MNFLDAHLLSAIVFLPLVGAVIALAFPRNPNSGVRGFAMAITLADAALALVLWDRFNPTLWGMQFGENVEWIPSWGIQYAVGVDGIAILLVMLTVFLAPIVVLSTYSSVTKNVREYMVCLLLLQTGMLGAFVATDLFLFYVFWELMLIPMYFLIGIWGGAQRIYAALKFFLYTFAGSVLMLVAIIYTVWSVKDAGGLTFSWAEVTTRLSAHNLGGAEIWLFLAFALAFAVKVPMFPFHTWLPDAHVEAPTGGSVILAGVLLKLGTFGFLRYAFWFFPEAGALFLPAIGLIAVIGIIYGALVAMVQKDLKRLVAYSSVSHLGFVMLGLAAMTVAGISGGVLQMINHGVSTGALFLLVGVIYERRHTRMIADFGGLAKVMPRYAAVFLIITLSSIGLPGLNGFVGEFMILVGAFQSEGIGITLPTGALADYGVYALQLIGLVGFGLIAWHFWRVEKTVGKPTRIFAVVLAAFALVALVAPAVAGFDGGLLVRPLQGARGDSAAFGEIFAVYAIFAATGVIFAAVYMLWAVQRVFFGPITHHENENLSDLSAREGLVFLPLLIGVFVLGLYPQPFIDAINPTVVSYAQSVRQRANLAPLATNTTQLQRLPNAPPRLPNLPGGFLAPPEGVQQRMPRVPPVGDLPWRERIKRLRKLPEPEGQQ